MLYNDKCFILCTQRLPAKTVVGDGKNSGLKRRGSRPILPLQASSESYTAPAGQSEFFLVLISNMSMHHFCLSRGIRYIGLQLDRSIQRLGTLLD